uniref:Uncharacterized protein n=1 Tax=Anopheles melas TaxID=34690 RepID=A0A182UE72_9DIPT
IPPIPQHGTIFHTSGSHKGSAIFLDEELVITSGLIFSDNESLNQTVADATKNSSIVELGTELKEIFDLDFRVVRKQENVLQQQAARAYHIVHSHRVRECMETVLEGLHVCIGGDMKPDNITCVFNDQKTMHPKLIYKNPIFDSAYDIALMEATFEEAQSSNWFCQLANYIPRIGQRLYAVGFPVLKSLARGINFKPSIIPGRATKYSEGLLFTDCSIQCGQSGGPIFDENGLLVAIAVSNFKSSMDNLIYNCHNMCAKETPEPIYDLEDCNLKDVPAGVFVMCKVLRKEALTLSKNKLSSLAGGGTLDDLVLLQSLNLSYNRFKKLPEDIYKLENLRELFLANNALEKLPIAIGRLKKLELLNLSANNLATVEQLAFMTNLRVLDISGNVRLSQLPSQLATCDNLVDIVLDPEHLVNPPPDVVAGGTYAIIKYLSTDEQTANELVNNLLALKNGPDPAFLEQEREEQKRLLEHLHIQQNDLRKQEILGAMTNLLENEINIIQNFHNQRDQSSRSILEREYETNNLLNNVFLNYDRNRQDVIDQITCNEDIQKSAVAALIARNDSRTWGLVEQVRIVESQLAALTLYEIERKKVNQDDQILLDTLKMIEKQKESEQTDFWLLQYQRLLDRQPAEVSNDTASIDPVLGYQFLVNGVVHCLPFLSKLWQNKDKELCNIADQDLLNAGVQNPTDRQGILQSIANYYDYLNCKIDYPEGESVSGTPMATAPSDEGYSPEANGRRRSSSVELGLEVEATPGVPLSGPSAGNVARGSAVISSEPTSPVSGAAPVAQFAECVVCMEQLV